MNVMILVVVLGFVCCTNAVRASRSLLAHLLERRPESYRVSHDTHWLGVAPHPRDSSRNVTGYALLHVHKRSWRARALVNSVSKHVHFNRSLHVSGEACTAPISPHAHWRSTPGFEVFTKSRQGIPAEQFVAAATGAAESWRCLLASRGLAAIGPMTAVDKTRSARDMCIDAPDGHNQIGFGPVHSDGGTVALTTLWGVFDGPLSERELTEFKIVLDEESFPFGDSAIQKGVVDTRSTLTHELGHANGIDDGYIASSTCEEGTMFGTSAENEIKKRSIETSDAEVLFSLYQTS